MHYGVHWPVCVYVCVRARLFMRFPDIIQIVCVFMRMRERVKQTDEVKEHND